MCQSTIALKIFPHDGKTSMKFRINTNLQILNCYKHILCRWLTILLAAYRILEQWDAILEYFLKCVPVKQKHIEKTVKFETGPLC